MASGGGCELVSLIERLVSDGFDELGIRYLFSRPEVRFEPGAMSSKLEALIKNQSKKPGEDPAVQAKAVYKAPLKEKMIFPGSLLPPGK